VILILKRILCIILAFQLSGCSQAVIKARHDKENRVAEKYIKLEEECAPTDGFKDLDALEESIKCYQDTILPMMDEEKYEYRDIFEKLYSDELLLVEKYKVKKAHHKNIKKIREEINKHIQELKDNATKELSDRETQHTVTDQQNAKAAGDAVKALAVIGAVVGGTYYVAKHGGFGGGGGSGGTCQITNSVQGCCSYHRGVNSCYAGRVVCNDGQYSPSCTCTCY